MLYFASDYMEGAYPPILERLTEINFQKNTGYGLDSICESAKAKIRTACGKENASVYFLSGGTQTNSTVIRSMLRLYEGVIAAETGHIGAHEAGTIESGGHKVVLLPAHEGKLCAADAENYLSVFYKDENREHMVKPGMVYVSHPSEYGTLYTKAELQALRSVCDRYGMKLYLDGARLGYALASDGTDVTLRDIADLCDAFYIGGTKVGALIGEAVVFPNGAPEGFFTVIKQSGALLAKGWLMGVQFDVLFEENTYICIARNAIDRAATLRAALKQKGYRFHIDTVTNQIFVVLENSEMEKLKKEVVFGFWETLDEDHTVIRFATSWATTEEDVNRLIALL